MSKALVIKGANFAVNKVTTVVLDNPVPCTGLTLSQSSITFSAIDATVQLTAEKTPLNTTDELTWVSSNEDVATVADGLVTCVGVGTTTIAATCGTQSATCEVTSTLTIVADDTWTVDNGHRYGGSVSLPTKNYISRSTNAAGRLFYSSTDELGGYRVFSGTANDGKYAIPIPKGTSKITITASEEVTKCDYGIAFCDTTQKQTYVIGSDGNSALAIYGVTIFNAGKTRSFNVGNHVADGANGFIFSLTFIEPSTIEEATGKTTVKFE